MWDECRVRFLGKYEHFNHFPGTGNKQRCSHLSLSPLFERIIESDAKILAESYLLEKVAGKEKRSGYRKVDVFFFDVARVGKVRGKV